MEKKREPKNDKFITGKMINCIGTEFNVFLGKNMSIFRCGDDLFIKLPYEGDIKGNFLEDNRSPSERGPLNSFFIDEKSEILSFYPINCKIEITSNDNKKTFKFIKEKNTTSSKDTEIVITHPTFTQTKINKEYLVIDDTTTIADIFKQLKIQNLMPNKIKQPNNKANNSGNKNKSTTKQHKKLIQKEIKPPNNKTNSVANYIKKTHEPTKQLNKEVLIKKEIEQTNNKTENIANDIKETNEPVNNTSNSLFDEKCCCGFSLNDIKNNLCCCL